jgi:antitoxin (DNA-binding transcriptional repressor) of toxin-antitoxin stability system
MHEIDITEAEGRLAELVAEAFRGEKVVITRKDGASVEISPMLKPRPKFGSAKGLVKMSENFDEPLEDFDEYAP